MDRHTIFLAKILRIVWKGCNVVKCDPPRKRGPIICGWLERRSPTGRQAATGSDIPVTGCGPKGTCRHDPVLQRNDGSPQRRGFDALQFDCVSMSECVGELFRIRQNLMINVSFLNREMIKNYPRMPDNKSVMLLPQYHVLGLSSIFDSLIRGLFFVLIPKFSLRVLLQSIQDYKVFS